MLVSLVLAVALTVFAAYFATNNPTVIQINLLGYPVRQTTGILIVSALGLGMLLGILVMLPAVVSRSWALIRHKRQMQDWQDNLGRKYSAGEEPKQE